jgi:hypothetical protein
VTTDAVTEHMAELGRRLRGPARLRRSILAETRDGLRDAAAAHEDGGLAPAAAASRAVRDFGAVGEIAPLYQDELTARQGRRTAVLLAVTYPGLALGWSLLAQGGGGWTRPPTPLVAVLARLQDAVSWGVGIAALVALALTFRRRPPRRLAAAIAALGAAGTVLCGGSAAVMVAGNGRPDPLSVVAYGISAAALVITVWSAARTLRTAVTSHPGPSATPPRSPRRGAPRWPARRREDLGPG